MTEDQNPVEQPQQAAESAPQQPTVMGIFSLIYTALNEAGKLANDADLAEKTQALNAALSALPQPLLDSLVQNVVNTYRNLETLRVVGQSFSPSEDKKMIIGITTVEFGDRRVDMLAPFDHDGAKSILSALQSAMDVVHPPLIIRPN